MNIDPNKIPKGCGVIGLIAMIAGVIIIIAVLFNLSSCAVNSMNKEYNLSEVIEDAKKSTITIVGVENGF